MLTSHLIGDSLNLAALLESKDKDTHLHAHTGGHTCLRGPPAHLDTCSFDCMRTSHIRTSNLIRISSYHPIALSNLARRYWVSNLQTSIRSSASSMMANQNMYKSDSKVGPESRTDT